MSIVFNQTIIHVLDLTMNMPVFSTEPLVLTDETEAFITKHLMKIFGSPSSSKACFEIGSVWSPLFKEETLLENFQDLSERLAQKYYDFMQSYGNILSGDLLITYFQMNNKGYLATLKLNYKEGFTHYVEQKEGRIQTHIIKHKGLFPAAGKQVDEAFLIELASGDITLWDHSKAQYLPLLYECEADLSLKETLKVVEAVATEVIETHYDNTLDAMAELRNNIVESIATTNTLPIQEVFERTFEKDEEVKEMCLQKMDELGLKEKTLEIADTKISNHYASSRLKTDTGIELKFPTPLFKNQDFIEIINEADGTLSIVLKNISHIINK
ncbi:nucleoid-associated protein [Sporanaerobium hydrogeniformans]|uniref:nucleoid-associated protein n=1 Tax=Sporanaerobium hydrogeniformans TaxID=3072179 RepID=UPI0015D4C608|nr:nucleoid-associated protein [Sporanaerobium hydrogeniformans]